MSLIEIGTVIENYESILVHKMHQHAILEHDRLSRGHG